MYDTYVSNFITISIMKKFIRKLFSPTFFIILILLFELIILAGGWFFLDSFLDSLLPPGYEFLTSLAYFIIRFVMWLLEVLVFFRIINKYENPEYKVTWIAFMAVFPITTVIMYLIFANHGLRKKDRRIIEPTNKIQEELFTLREEEIDDFRANVPLEYRGIFKYLRKTTRLTTSTNNRLTYYKNGEQFFPAFIESLKEAKEFIFMEFFIIGEGRWGNQIDAILKQKAKEGVEIRLIYDDMGSFGLLPSNYPKQLKKYGIKCYKFNKFKPLLSGIYNNRTHRKIAVIDHKYGFTGGMNLADEYANDIVRFGYWKDTMVRIEGRGIENLIAIFLQNFDLCTHNVSNYEHYINYDYEKFDGGGYVFSFGDGPGSFDGNEAIGEQNYLNIINTAKRTLWISTPYLIPTYRLMEALKNAAKRGVEVNLFVPGIPDKPAVYWMAKCDFHILVEAGVNIYLYTPGFNHEKECLADDVMAFVGTINFDYRSLTHHFECGIDIYNDPCIKEIKEDFLEMQMESKKIDKTFKVNIFQRFAVSILKLFRTLL